MPRVKVISSMEDHPLVEYDDAMNMLFIQGVCMPENAIEMFAPIFTKVTEVLAGKKTIHLHLYFKYLNSMSSKQMLRMLLQIASTGKGTVTWCYAPGDDLMRFKGNEFKSLLPETISFELKSVD